jgi:hypothetical protein
MSASAFGNNIEILRNTAHQVVWRVPSGKLNDQNQRTLQTAQKGQTCWYYASKCLWPNGQIEFKQQASEYRKEETTLCKLETAAIDFFRSLRSLIKSDGNSILIPSIRDDIVFQNSEEEFLFRESYELIETFLQSTELPLAEIDMPAFQQFVENELHERRCTSLYQFAQETLDVSLEDLIMDLMEPKSYQSLPHLPEDERNELIDALTETMNSSLAKMEPKERFSIFSRAFLKYYCNQLHFTACAWQPDQQITKMIEALSKYGPMLAAGSFGSGFYESPSVEFEEKIADHTVRGWVSESLNELVNSLVRHVIVVVGAEVVDDKPSVYYIDPNDSSHPDTLRVMYKISYERFTSGIETYLDDSIPLKERGYLMYQLNLPK